MDEPKTSLELLRDNYQERAKRLNGLADAALSEAIASYREAQDKTIASAVKVADEASEDAKAKAKASLSDAETKANEILLSTYIESGLRR